MSSRRVVEDDADARAGREGRPSTMGLPRGAADALVAVLIALLIWLLIGPTVTASDTWWGLIWGRELLSGQVPTVDAVQAPTPHPLSVLVSAALNVLGSAAAVDLTKGLALVATGATFAALYRLGRATLGGRVAWVAIVVAACNLTLIQGGANATLDAVAWSLGLWAVALVALDPARGAVPLWLLAAAGLQRPEFWALSGAYWLYLAVRPDTRRRALRLAPVAAAPVVGWAAFDVLTTGDANSSLTTTQAAAERAVASKPSLVLDSLRSNLRAPLIPVALTGAVLALWTAPARARVPLAAAAVGFAALNGLALLDVVVVARFVVVPSLIGALFVGYAALGGIGRPGTAGRVWRAGGVLVVLLIAMVAVQQVRGLQDLRDKLAGLRASTADYASLQDDRRVRDAVRRCSPVWMQFVSADVVFLSRRDPGVFRLARSEPPVPGTASQVPAGGLVIGGLSPLKSQAGDERFRLVLPGGFRSLAERGPWRVYKRGC